MTQPKSHGTAADPDVATTVMPAGWVHTTTSITSEYVLLAQDTHAMEAEIERYAAQPVDDFTRLDDFLSELDG